MNSSKKYIETYPSKITDYYSLMDIICGKNGYEDIRKDYIFRGMSNITHRLIPSSLREHSKINEYIGRDFRFRKVMSEDDAFKEGIIKQKGMLNVKWIAPTIDKNGDIVKGEGYSIIQSDDELQFKRELYVLLKFLDFSDRNGLKVTADYKVRENIHNYFHFTSKFWPRMEFIEIISLAQHYGVPTKVLDWTYDYKVALYFALRDILKDKNNYSDGYSEEFLFPGFDGVKLAMKNSVILENKLK